MKIKECILENIKKCFKNTSIPSDSLFKEKMKKHLSIDCNVVERDENHMVVELLFEDSPMVLEFIFTKSAINLLFVSDICEII